MCINSSAYNNNSTGIYNSYVSYVDGIVVPHEDPVAKEALFFMLVSFRGHWKYPVRYVLIMADSTNRPHKHPAFQKTVGKLFKIIFLNVSTNILSILDFCK